MADIKLVRQELDRMVRPGQAGTSVLAHRLTPGHGMRGGDVALLNRWDVAGGAKVRSGVYGRAQYGTARYSQAQRD